MDNTTIIKYVRNDKHDYYIYFLVIRSSEVLLSDKGFQADPRHQELVIEYFPLLNTRYDIILPTLYVHIHYIQKSTRSNTSNNFTQNYKYTYQGKMERQEYELTEWCKIASDNETRPNVGDPLFLIMTLPTLPFVS